MDDVNDVEMLLHQLPQRIMKAGSHTVEFIPRIRTSISTTEVELILLSVVQKMEAFVFQNKGLTVQQ